MAVTVEPFTTDMVKRAPITWSKLDVNGIRHNQVGAFTLTVPATDRNWDLVVLDGNGDFVPFGSYVDWNGVFQVPLLVEGYNPSKQVDDTGNTIETITFTGADFLALLANRMVFRTAAAWSSQTIGSTTVTDKAETVIKNLITANAVSASETARNVPNLTVAPDLARGGTVSYTTVIKDPAATTVDKTATIGDSLMDMVRAVALQSPIGVRIDLVDGELVVDCYIPRDLSELAVFSTDLGNLRAWALSDAAPTSNAILMQSGATSGAFTETSGAGATDPWRRVETFSDQSSTNDAAQITAAQNEAVAQGAPVRQLNMTGVDIPRLRFGKDATGVQGYGVGDLVGGDLHDGITYTDIISAVQLTADATAEPYTERVTPTVGTADDSGGDDTTAVARLAARVRALEQLLKRG
jgi:hypothetical protein